MPARTYGGLIGAQEFLEASTAASRQVDFAMDDPVVPRVRGERGTSEELAKPALPCIASGISVELDASGRTGVF